MMHPERKAFSMKKLLFFLVLVGIGVWLAKQAGILTCSEVTS